jgi:hypothetical protein
MCCFVVLCGRAEMCTVGLWKIWRGGERVGEVGYVGGDWVA